MYKVKGHGTKKCKAFLCKGSNWMFFEWFKTASDTQTVDYLMLMILLWHSFDRLGFFLLFLLFSLDLDPSVTLIASLPTRIYRERNSIVRYCCGRGTHRVSTALCGVAGRLLRSHSHSAPSFSFPLIFPRHTHTHLELWTWTYLLSFYSVMDSGLN